MTRGTILRGLLAAIAIGGGLVGVTGAAGCFGDGAVKRCTSADDCSAPFLCCVGGTAVEVEGGPHCVIPDPSLSFCTGYLAHLVEGNPCGRVTPAADAAAVSGGLVPPPVEADTCREGLVCCAATLTCTTEGDCRGEDAPADATSSGTACRADDECTAPEVCCGISYYDRDGSCALVRDCPEPTGEAGATTGGG